MRTLNTAAIILVFQVLFAYLWSKVQVGIINHMMISILKLLDF